jgi:alkylation response protein AidB-like acyl-CoA dehydrogenase
MDFALTPDQEAFQRTVREFCKAEIAPHAQAWDRDERFPRDVIDKLGPLGVMGIVIDEKYGGAGADYSCVATVVEEFARWDGSVAITVASHNGLCTGHINHAGNQEQKQRYLPRLASGQTLGAWCLTEPGSGSDAGAARTRAVKQGDRWILNGTKMFITQGSVAGVYVVLASTSPEKKQKGLTAFIVEAGQKGLRVGKHLEKMGLHASDTCEVVFEDVEVADENRLGELDAGFKDTLRILERGRITIGAMALGLGRGALEDALHYAKERNAFGRPIADFQAIQWMLADSATELDAARLLIQRAAFLQDKGVRTNRESAMAKLYASEAASRACYRAIQVHGGYGYVREYNVERYFRDVRLCEIGEGTSEIQRTVIARHVLSLDH